MNRERVIVLGMIVLLLLGTVFFLWAGSDARYPALGEARVRVVPLRFEENQGQTADEVEFLSRSARSTLFLTRRTLVFALYGSHSNPHVVRMSFAGLDRDPELQGLELQATKSNYFIGRNPAQWRTNIANYSGVEYRDIYPGISLVLSGAPSYLNARLIILPGANPATFRIGFEGADALQISRDGHLTARTAAGEILQGPPQAYQEIGRVRTTVPAVHRIEASQWTLQVGDYDRAVPLVVAFDLFIAVGGSADDEGTDIAVDGTGNIYLAGTTNSADFPAAGLFQSGKGGSRDGFVTKLNSQGTAAIYSTYIGGNQTDSAMALDADTAGNAYLFGATVSTDFPTASAFQSNSAGVFAGVCALDVSCVPIRDAFVAKLNGDGNALIYSTYLGGTGDEVPGGIAVDNQGNATVAGYTTDLTLVGGGAASRDFPTFQPFQSRPGGGLADAFVTRLDVAVDASGNAYIAGTTKSLNFPTVRPIQTAGGGRCTRAVFSIPPFVLPAFMDVPCDDAFVAKLNPAGTALVYSTVIGGSGDDGANAVDVDDSGNVVVTGRTAAPNFPTTLPFRASFGGGFVTKLNSDASAFIYSAYLPRADGRIRMDGSGNVYVISSGVMKLNRDGVVVGSSFPFASGLAVSPSGALYLSGTTGQSGLTTHDRLGTLFLTPPVSVVRALVGLSDAFIARLVLPEDYSRVFAVERDSGVLLRTDGTAAMSTSGYARVEPYRSALPAGLALLSYRKGNTLVSETAVGASFPTGSARVFVEAGAGVNTSLAIVNPTSQPAPVSFFFTDANGNDFGRGSFDIPANGQIVRLITQSPFNRSSPLTATLTFNASVPVGIVPIRILTNERSDPLISAMPVADLTGGQGGLPYFADGGGWATRIVLVNPTDQFLSGAIQFWGPGTATAAAQPVVVDVDGQSASSFPYTIAPRSSRVFRTSGVRPTARTGSVRVVSSDRTPFIAGTMSYKPAGTTISETSVSPVPQGGAFRVYVQGLKNFAAREPGSIETYVVVTNESSEPVDVALELTRITGDSVGSPDSLAAPPRVINGERRTLPRIPGNGQRTFLLREAFPTVEPPFEGLLRVVVPPPPFTPFILAGNFSVVGLHAQYNEAGELLVSSVPAVKEDSIITIITPPPPLQDAPRAASEFLLFPHLIDGGGYSTRFVILGGSSGRSSFGVLKLFGPSGETLKLPLR